MTRRTTLALWCAIVPAVLLGADAPAPAPAASTIVLDTGSFWRTYFQMRPAVVHKDGKVEPVDMGGAWLNEDTPGPAAEWMKRDFDDGSWARVPAGFANLGWRDMSVYSPMVALECRRGKFAVTDPQAAGDMTLSIEFLGGAVVYLNGAEIARANLPGGGELADDYPPEAAGKLELLTRKLSDVRVPKALLVKGTNVLAIELRRAAYREGEIAKDARGRSTVIRWGNCGLAGVTLSVASGAGLVANTARPKGFQVWNSDATAADFDLDYGDPNEPLRPVTLVSARGGAASGKVVVGSDEPIRGLKATAGALTARGRAGTIPASAIEVRYATPWGNERGTEARYPAPVDRFDALDETPPAEVPVCAKLPVRGSRKKPDELKALFGAVCPVWVTVRVPADAPAGEYEGTLTVAAAGQKAVTVPLRLTVSAWKAPPPGEWRAVFEMIQSPDTLALQYDAPLWSDKHFALIEKSFARLAEAGDRFVYVPLIAETNLGNAESMVRWVKKPDGTYDYDFAVFDRYLDVVQRHVKPRVLALAFWDVYLERIGYFDTEPYVAKEVKEDRTAHKGQGPILTRLDPATGKTENFVLPQFSEEGSKALWKPLCDALRARLKARGLESAATLGFCTDAYPTQGVMDLFKELMPLTPWMRASHGGDKLYDAKMAYVATVWGPRFGRPGTDFAAHGWRDKLLKLFFLRAAADPMPLPAHRAMTEIAITGDQRGVGRIGGDLWPVVRDRRGRIVGRASDRYPKSSWRALNIVTSYLAPGATGPVATTRFEMVRENLEECEARIVIEQALVDGKLSEPLTAKAKALLDARLAANLRGTSAFLFGEHFTINSADNHSWWHLTGPLGAQWFVSSGWQERRRALFDLAAEVQQF